MRTCKFVEFVLLFCSNAEVLPLIQIKFECPYNAAEVCLPLSPQQETIDDPLQKFLPSRFQTKKPTSPIITANRFNFVLLRSRSR